MILYEIMRELYQHYSQPNIPQAEPKHILREAFRELDITTDTLILPKGADPYVAINPKKGGLFYVGSDTIIQPTDPDGKLNQTIDQGYIFLLNSPTLSRLQDSDPIPIWPTQKDQKKGVTNHAVWAPEMHQFGDKWYIYYAATRGKNKDHRGFVLESNSDDPRDGFHQKGQLHVPKADYWMIDFTVMQHSNGELYGVWSGWDYTYQRTDFPQNLFIAHMKNPWTIDSERSPIAKPEHPWQNSVQSILEGPQVIQTSRDGVQIMFSANASWTDKYCLGLLQQSGHNPLDPNSWYMHPEPIFKSHTTRDAEIIGPGHACVLHTEAGSILVYHTKTSLKDGWKDRAIRARPFEWNPDGTPQLMPREYTQRQTIYQAA